MDNNKYNLDYFYERATETFDKKYYEEDAKKICLKKGWDQSQWEEIAEFFESLQIEKSQLKALEHLVTWKLISDMEDALA